MSDYATLQTDIIEYLKDTQVDAAKARDFIRLAEGKLQRDMLDLRYGGSVPHYMLISLLAVTNQESAYSLPVDFFQAREVSISGTRARYVAPGAHVHLRAGSTIDAQGAEFVLHYYQKLPPLTDANPTNWLLDIAYDCYLWAACLYYGPWGQEVETMPIWREMYTDAITSIKANTGAQPRGGFSASKAKGYGTSYTVSDNKLWFAPTPGAETPPNSVWGGCTWS